MPPEEVRRTLLDAGLVLLVDEGLFGGLSLLKLDWAIASSRVPRTTAYGLFETAENYRREVLLHAVRSIPAGDGMAETYSLALEILDERADDLNSGDSGRIEAARAELLRRTTTRNFDLLDGSREWRIFRAVVLAMQTQPESDDAFHEAIEDAETKLVAMYAIFFEEMAIRLHLVRRDGVTAEEFAMSAYALNDGLANRATRSYRRHGYRRESGDWSLLGLGFEALVYQFYEKTA